MVATSVWQDPLNQLLCNFLVSGLFFLLCTCLPCPYVFSEAQLLSAVGACDLGSSLLVAVLYDEHLLRPFDTYASKQQGFDLPLRYSYWQIAVGMIILLVGSRANASQRQVSFMLAMNSICMFCGGLATFLPNTFAQLACLAMSIFAMWAMLGQMVPLMPREMETVAIVILWHIFGLFWIVQYLEFADISDQLSILDVATKLLLFFVMRAQDAREYLKNALLLAERRSVCLATLAHEIRTPLHTAIASMDLEEDPAIARTALSYMLTLCNDVLTIASMENRTSTVNKETFMLCDLVTEVFGAASLSPHLRSEVNLRLDVAVNAPTLIHTSRIRVRQILDNLLNNAMHYTYRGTITLRVESQLATVIFIVTDTGIGIPPDKLVSIFEPFVRIKGDYHAGVGLGLSIVKYTAELLGGQMNVTSNFGVGSEFRLELPLTNFWIEDQAKPTPIVKPHHKLQGSVSCEKRILVVEDNTLNRKLLVKMLERTGFTTIEEAEDGRFFVDMFTPGRYDAIFVDLHMPRLDGLGAIKELLAGGHELPFIFVCTASIYSIEDELWNGLTPHCFLRKPITLANLRAALELRL